MRSPLLPAVLACTLFGAACVAPGADDPVEATGGLQPPTFDALPGATEASEPAAADTSAASSPPTGAPTSPTPPPATSSPRPSATHASPSPSVSASPTAATVLRGTVADGTDDMQGLTASRAPAHADLREAVLRRTGGSFTIRIGFAGPAPSQGERDEILNVATYHDVTGDGRIDYEIWASLTSDGWGTSWYDIADGTARFAADDDVEVEVVDGSVVLTFPPRLLADARSGRWMLSAEWGTSVTISSGTAATDDAPDDRTGRSWPS